MTAALQIAATAILPRVHKFTSGVVVSALFDRAGVQASTARVDNPDSSKQMHCRLLRMEQRGQELVPSASGTPSAELHEAAVSSCGASSPLAATQAVLGA